ncbi:RPII140-upstream gene protein [Trichoplusia ni]|uniref:Complex I assembly factor TIMMDC1, mitochondrial n=1 Tax=Trichoplusia ni TaxID=7111 RepID=A0A7E5VM73_TRINI|nr:RPII140-upstream gene protein [Trichoplusia ni]
MFFRSFTMWKTAVRLTPAFSVPIFTAQRNQHDQVLVNSADSIKPKTGWERVKQMYSRSEYEEISVELNTVLQSALSGAFVGGCLGGFVSSRVAYLDFIENNQATIFKSTANAKKRLQDYVTVAFARGAYKWGWRLCFFTGLFSLTATTVSVYRGDTSLIEYISAGALTGALYKINLGLPAVFVGAALGTVLSTAAGLAIIGLLKVTGLSMADIRKALYSVKVAREDQYNQVLEKAATIKNDELTQHHKDLIAETGEISIDDIE